MPVTDRTIQQSIDEIVRAYNHLAIGNEGAVTVERFDVHFPEVDLKIVVRAKETFRDPITRRRQTLYSITGEIEGTIDLTKLDESADKLKLRIHLPMGREVVMTVEQALQLVKILALILA